MSERSISERTGSEFAEGEFTGERVIPGLVDADLFNEHLARYRFANRIATGMAAAPRVFDAGCGTGYGSAEMTGAASITAADISGEAIAHAKQSYARPGVHFLQAACEALPLGQGAFDMVTAFEVIEHLERWPQLVAEANRILKPSGALVVSTPNRAYYAASRGDAGPNPFHRHEFTYDEFHAALRDVFAHVRIWTQNHAGAIVFSPQDTSSAGPVETVLDAVPSQDKAGAHFFVAVCSQTPIVADDTYAWLPTTANVLQERERHISKLLSEVAQKEAWLLRSVADHSQLQKDHEALEAELDKQNRWASELNREISQRNSRIVALQEEVTSRLAWVADLEAQITRGNAEIARLNQECQEVESSAQANIDRLEAIVTERSQWALSLNDEIGEYKRQLKLVADSRWVRAGVRMGLVPRLRDER